MAGVMRTVTNTDAWEAMRDTFDTVKDSTYGALKRFGEIPERADRIAEREFPGSARDASQKNAFRHALGTGMMTQALGGNDLSAAAAKGAGYLWEALGALDYFEDPDHRTDTRHDLNANAIGARTATEAKTQEELVRRLRALANESRQERPPLVYEGDRGYLTRSVR